MKTKKSLLACLMLFILLVTTAIPAFSAVETNDNLKFDELSGKSADPLSRLGEYEITLSVPGEFDNDMYNEIIVMVDASTSQSKNFASLKNMLLGLGENFFD